MAFNKDFKDALVRMVYDAKVAAFYRDDELQLISGDVLQAHGENDWQTPGGTVIQSGEILTSKQVQAALDVLYP